MRRVTPYKLAGGVLLLFCAAHTLGGMLGRQSLGAEADQVFAAMQAVRFDFQGAESTWYGFWFGFGLMLSVFLAFSALAAGCLDAVRPEHWPSVSALAWLLCASHVGIAALTWAYFFPLAGVFATAATVLLGVGALGKQRAAQPAPALAPHG